MCFKYFVDNKLFAKYMYTTITQRYNIGKSVLPDICIHTIPRGAQHL